MSRKGKKDLILHNFVGIRETTTIIHCNINAYNTRYLNNRPELRD